MPALPEDFYDCLVATLFRGKATMNMELSYLTFGKRFYSNETRIKERRKNVLDIVRLRQTCKAMLIAVRALEAEELRAAVSLFWQAAQVRPMESLVFPSMSGVPSPSPTMQSHMQMLKYENRDEMILFTKRAPRMMKLVLVTPSGTKYDAKCKKACFPKIIFRIEDDAGATHEDSGSDSDGYMPHTEVSTKECELACKVKVWLEQQRAQIEGRQAVDVVTKV